MGEWGHIIQGLERQPKKCGFPPERSGRDLGREGHIRGLGVKDGWEEDGWAPKDRHSLPAKGACPDLHVVNSPAGM